MTLVAELVIFDCDGVLVDSEVISNRVLAAMLTEQGLPTTLPQARREYQGMLLADVLANAEAKLGRSLPADWLARYEAERSEAFRRELEPVVGVAETVERLRGAGLRVCVASQGKPEKTRLSSSRVFDHLCEPLAHDLLNSIRCWITADSRPLSSSVCSTREKPPRSTHTTRSSS